MLTRAGSIPASAISQVSDYKQAGKNSLTPWKDRDNTKLKGGRASKMRIEKEMTIELYDGKMVTYSREGLKRLIENSFSALEISSIKSIKLTMIDK